MIVTFEIHANGEGCLQRDASDEAIHFSTRKRLEQEATKVTK